MDPQAGAKLADIGTFLATLHPYDSLPRDEVDRLTATMALSEHEAGDTVFALGTALPGLFVVVEGRVDIRDTNGVLVSILGPGNSFGERGLQRGGYAMTAARTAAPTRLLCLPAAEFHALTARFPAFAKFFDRSRPGAAPRPPDLASMQIADLMATKLLTCSPAHTVAEAARMMRDRHVSCILVTEQSADRLIGILTTGDLTNRALAEGRSPETPVAQVMTPNPRTLSPEALGSDVLHMMLEHGFGHLPVERQGRLVGIVTQTNLTRYQAISSGHLIHEIVGAGSIETLAATVAKIPQLLAQLVGAGNRHDIVTRLVTDIGDAATRRLLRLAEEALGPPPVPYLWLACGSQGRQEQTGVSDQDNCLFLDDAAHPEHDPYFAALAKFVCDGLDTCGYYYCPGEMMATTRRWRQPLRVWRDYFSGWIAKPDPMAQMLASVMFDLRPVGGDETLFADLHARTLEAAAQNSIFVAHMIANSLKHTPPLGLIRGFATIRSGEHKDTLDLKMNGVVPVVDLGRIYALTGRIEPVNTRARIVAAEEAGVISASGGRDLRDAYDLIAETRLEHQAALIRAGAKPDNYMKPASLSDLERSHLRDAFVVVKTMQSAAGHGRSAAM